MTPLLRAISAFAQLRAGTRAASCSLTRQWQLVRGPSDAFWDVNVFLEGLVPEFLECRVNCLFPHQEWLTDEDRKRLRDIDMVFFKTRHAMDILESETKASAFIGFTSPDRQDSSVSPRWDTALHVCGWNPHKGTAAVLGAWSKHSDWPHLTIVSQLPMSASPYPNVERLATRVADSQLRRSE